MLKNIIVGVCGGIAAYKVAELIRLLVKQGMQVQVVMTHSAEKFMTPLTFQALSGKPVRTQLFDQQAEAGMGHIELARWADLLIIAPATANTLAKIAHGLSDNLLTTLCLATQAPILIAPAMNQQMWHQVATQKNIKTLSQYPSLSFCGPETGEQACGDVGLGRMADVNILFNRSLHLLTNTLASINDSQSLQGKKVLITAGPTIEDIDPVRYLTNRSSGKMGYAIAQAALQAGADVILVSGPTHLDNELMASLKNNKNVQLIAVRSAIEMYNVVFQWMDSVDIFIATAAVADYRPAQKVTKKIKKQQNQQTLELIKNPDILASVSALKNPPIVIGFAAETNDLTSYALKKLKAKNLDMIAANKVGETDSGKTEGFESDNNELHLFWQDKQHCQNSLENNNTKIHSKVLPYANKTYLAQQLITEIILQLLKKE
jgi:phosphopantothenoylcysteine decarboxylase/phosphopantothenate--cysteine ligase